MEISHRMSPRRMICVKCQTRFSAKQNKNQLVIFWTGPDDPRKGWQLMASMWFLPSYSVLKIPIWTTYTLDKMGNKKKFSSIYSSFNPSNISSISLVLVLFICLMYLLMYFTLLEAVFMISFSTSLLSQFIAYIISLTSSSIVLINTQLNRDLTLEITSSFRFWFLHTKFSINTPEKKINQLDRAVDLEIKRVIFLFICNT